MHNVLEMFQISLLEAKPPFNNLPLLQFPLPTSTQPAFTCSKSTIETPEEGVKYIQS